MLICIINSCALRCYGVACSCWDTTWRQDELWLVSSGYLCFLLQFSDAGGCDCSPLESVLKKRIMLRIIHQKWSKFTKAKRGNEPFYYLQLTVVIYVCRDTLSFPLSYRQPTLVSLHRDHDCFLTLTKLFVIFAWFVICSGFGRLWQTRSSCWCGRQIRNVFGGTCCLLPPTEKIFSFVIWV